VPAGCGLEGGGAPHGMSHAPCRSLQPRGCEWSSRGPCVSDRRIAAAMPQRASHARGTATGRAL
jgi:hypothetical protein